MINIDGNKYFKFLCLYIHVCTITINLISILDLKEKYTVMYILLVLALFSKPSKSIKDNKC